MKPEDALHRSVADFLTLALKPEVWWTTFPAGGGGKARGGQLKAMGLKAGVPDVLILYEGDVYWIELKSAKGRCSPEQTACHDALMRAGGGGGSVVVCRSLEDVKRVLVWWGVPMRRVRLFEGALAA